MLASKFKEMCSPIDPNVLIEEWKVYLPSYTISIPNKIGPIHFFIYRVELPYDQTLQSLCKPKTLKNRIEYIAINNSD